MAIVAKHEKFQTDGTKSRVAATLFDNTGENAGHRVNEYLMQKKNETGSGLLLAALFARVILFEGMHANVTI